MNSIIYQLILIVIDGSNKILCAGGRGGAIAAKGGSRSFGSNISNVNDDSGSLSVILVVILPVAQMFAVLAFIIMVRFCYRRLCQKKRRRKSFTGNNNNGSGILRGLSRVSPLHTTPTIVNQLMPMMSGQNNESKLDKRHSNGSDQFKSASTSLPPNGQVLVAKPDQHQASPPTRLLLTSAITPSNASVQPIVCSSQIYTCCGGRNIPHQPSKSPHCPPGQLPSQSLQHNKAFHPSIGTQRSPRIPTTSKSASNRSHCYNCPLISTVCDVHSSNTTASSTSNSNGNGNHNDNHTNVDQRQSRDNFDYYNDSDDELGEEDNEVISQLELEHDNDNIDIDIEYGPSIYSQPLPSSSSLLQQSQLPPTNLRTNSCPNPNPKLNLSCSNQVNSRPFFCLHHQNQSSVKPLESRPTSSASSSSQIPINCRHTY